LPKVEISKATMMCNMFESLIREPGLLEKTLDRSRSRSIICQTFIFSYIWSVGGNLLDSSREKFEIFVHDQFDDNPDAQ
jgi:dynein heavy chain